MYATNSGNSNVLSHEMGLRSYELSNHLGNVLSVISDKVIPHPSGSSVAYYKADIQQAMDYSPFGVTLKGRNLKKTGSLEDFRFGFQGQEMDDEIKGEGNSVNFIHRMHDTRLGRFLSVDPLVKCYTWNSPYSFSCNNVIMYVELEGKEIATPEVFEEAKQALLCWFESESLSGNTETKVKAINISSLFEYLDYTLSTYQSTGASGVTTQDLGNYCGETSVQSVAVAYNPVGYVNFVIDLFMKGEATFSGSSDVLNIPAQMLSPEYKPFPQIEGLARATSGCDQAVGWALAESTDNLFRKLFLAEGSTGPYNYTELASKLGLTVIDKRIYGNDNEQSLNVIRDAITKGLLPVIFENHDISNPPNDEKNSEKGQVFGIHFIIITSIEVRNDVVNYSYMSSGEIKHNSCPVEQFLEGMKGYFIPENTTNNSTNSTEE